jgi:hypothetical protein
MLVFFLLAVFSFSLGYSAYQSISLIHSAGPEYDSTDKLTAAMVLINGYLSIFTMGYKFLCSAE